MVGVSLVAGCCSLVTSSWYAGFVAMKKATLLALVGPMALLLTGAVCGGLPLPDQASDATPLVSFTPSPCPVVRAEMVGDLVVELVLNGGELVFTPGEPISMTLAITNCEDETVRRVYASGQQYDFVVSDDQQREVWRWSHGKVFTQAIQETTFEPGETVTYTEVWDQSSNDAEQVAPGHYDVLGLDIGCYELVESCHFGMGLSIEITP